MVIWHGPSQLDGELVVVIVTGVTAVSSNHKTGNVAQIWILRDDVHPVDALRTGADRSVCGDCPHRPQVTGPGALKLRNRTCYVSTMALNAIYKQYQTGKYKHVSLEVMRDMLAHRDVRLGAYGDPAAVPIEVWDMLLARCRSTGYTHQWRTCDARFARYCMASCDTPIDVMLSSAMGYRAFYVQDVISFKHVQRSVAGSKFAWCPASKEMGRVTTCARCRACSGTRSGRQGSISIMRH